MKRAAIFAAAAVAIGCQSARTEVLVVVDNAGLAIPHDIDAVEVTVTDNALTGSSATLFDKKVQLCAHTGNGCFAPPISFTLVPGDSRPSDPVRVHVQALLGTQTVIDDAATFSFIKGQSTRLDFDLFPACVGSDCAASNRICAAGGQCVTAKPQPIASAPDLSASPRDGGARDLSAAGDLTMTPPDLLTPDLLPPPDLNPVTSCGGATVNIDTDPSNCGVCGNVCPAPTSPMNFHQAATCTAGVCGIGCAVGFGDCDGMASNGCEYPVTDTSNCGACGHVCGAKNTTAVSCTAGKCVLTCAPGDAHCSSDDSTGCETTIATDGDNCGYCGFQCGSATCIDSVCRYTAGSETIETLGNISVLQQDASTLYWFADNGSGTCYVRKVNKDGTGLGNVFTTTEGCPDEGAALGVDADYLYFFNDTYKGTIYKGTKSGVQQPQLVVNTGDASGTGLIVGGGYGSDARYLFETWEVNGTGLYRTDLSVTGTTDPNPNHAGGNVKLWQEVYTPPNGITPHSMTFFGDTLYFGTWGNSTYQIKSLTIDAATPTVSDIGTLPQTPDGLATDGTNIYAGCADGQLYIMPISTGVAKVMISGGGGPNGNAVVITDGVNVYVAGSALFRVPIASYGGSWASYKIVDNGSLPNGSAILAAQVDADAVYFADGVDVYKTKK
jgi:hypothetical protein